MIEDFIKKLKHKPSGCDLFSPWFDHDEKHDISPDAPEVRRRQFISYLQSRRGKAKYLFIAEALGYQGGHFTGIAMTSERILLGYQKQKYRVKPDDVFRDPIPERTSKPEVNTKGMSEPTATIMWGALKDLGIDPYQVVLWNAVPWHPYDLSRGILSNRTPTRKEMSAGMDILPSFFELFHDDVKIVAVGRKCEETLKTLGIEHLHVRHPANGGAPKFRRQLRDFVADS